MDALSFNPIQGGIASTMGGAMDAAAAADAGLAGIDFSMLLALELTLPQGQPALETEIKADKEALSAGDMQVPVAEMLIALPHPGTDVIAREAIAPDVVTEASSAAPATQTARTAALTPAIDVDSDAASAPAAAVADDTANIAAGAEKAPQPGAFAAESRSAEQRVEAQPDAQKLAGVDRTIETDAAANTTPPSHAAAAHVQPVEVRPSISQPSALLEVQAPVSEPGFAQALSRQVVWMVDKDAQIAELRINPPELGPVEVRLTLTQGSASAEFVSPHAEVRAAIEDAIVRLREAMAEAGIQLGEASVSAESFSARADAESRNRDAHDSRETHYADRAASASRIEAASVRHGLVDVFA